MVTHQEEKSTKIRHESQRHTFSQSGVPKNTKLVAVLFMQRAGADVCRHCACCFQLCEKRCTLLN